MERNVFQPTAVPPQCPKSVALKMYDPLARNYLTLRILSDLPSCSLDSFFGVVLEQRRVLVFGGTAVA